MFFSKKPQATHWDVFYWADSERNAVLYQTIEAGSASEAKRKFRRDNPNENITDVRPGSANQGRVYG
jgi:hypothetical protein